MAKGEGIRKVTTLLVLIGAINWGLVGLGMLFKLDWNLVAWLFGLVNGAAWIVAAIYVLVGASAGYLIVKKKKKVLN